MNAEMSQTLTRTGPGTPMGNLMRRYWVPILLSSEIAEPDGPQVRVQILGEKLLAFRDTSGQPGLIGEFCSHRGVSLYFGRNEENGIRCAYHGLKFDRSGQCVEVPSAPQACKHMGITAYPCIERGGIVWAYMGPKDKQPAPPSVEWCALPPSHVFVSKRLQECNYLQAMEGGIDTSHVSYVHSFEVDDDPMHQGTKANEYIKADGNVIFDIEKTDYGMTLYGRRNGEPDSYYWRITQWLFPWFTLIPPFGPHSLAGHVWVPIDDHNCWAWSINFHPNKPLSDEERRDMEAGKGIHCEYEPGSWRTKANKDNDYLMDRAGPEGEALVQRRLRLRGAGLVLAGKHGTDPGPREGEAAADRSGHRDGAADALRGCDGAAAGHRAAGHQCGAAARACCRRAPAARPEAAGVGEGSSRRRLRPAGLFDLRSRA